MSDSQHRPNRSVADFESADDLRRALKSMNVKQSQSDGQYVSFSHPALRQSEMADPNILREEDGSVGSAGTGQLDDDLDWVLENYDPEMTESQSLREELKRLLVLRSYLILDSERQESFERITGLASRIFKCPMALISLVDLGRQWFMSNRGLGTTRETNRKYAFCAHAIMGKEDFLIVPDATKDPRFKDNPLVTGPPDIRFYAGAPLVSPEGYKLGTLCVLDRKPRPEGLSLDDKTNLMELASLAVQAAVDHKRQRTEDFNDPAQLIAYTAHDLLTPLTGVQLSLSLLSEDEEFRSKLSQQQKEMISTASNCTDVMGKICQTTIDGFRKSQKKEKGEERIEQIASQPRVPTPTKMSDFVKSLYMVLDPFPKRVPLIITVDSSVPEAIVTDDLKVFRSAVNFLTNACAKTERGSVQLSITAVEESGESKLLFECEDTGPGVPVEKYPKLFRPFKNDPDEDEEDFSNSCIKPDANGAVDPISRIKMPNSGLGLYSVAVHISSIGGDYGFRPREDAATKAENEDTLPGSVFWFRVPLILPDSTTPVAISSLLNDFSTLNASLQELSNQDYRSGKNVTVLSTSTISEDDANKVYNAFTKVLEDGVPGGFALAAQAVTEAKIASKEDTAKKVGSAADSNMKEAVPVQEGQQRKRKALVIEDSMVVRKSLTRVLTKLGFDAVQAVDGMEGLKELQCSLFDVVFCDFLMPVMDGLDCVQQYREWEKEHRPFFKQYIIGISAHASDQDISKGMEVGMDDFKPKPVTFKQLAELDKSETLKGYSDQLDEIAAKGTLMVNASETQNGQDIIQVPGSGAANDGDKSQNTKSSDTAIHFCLIATDKKTSEISAIEKAARNKGWKSVIVYSGEDALKLMKLRNWDLILLDEDVPILASTHCVSRFREWEERNRVNRQRNVVLLSVSCRSFACGSKSVVQLPFGFDCSLGKPIRIDEFEFIMARAERSATDFGVRDSIVSR